MAIKCNVWTCLAATERVHFSGGHLKESCCMRVWRGMLRGPINTLLGDTEKGGTLLRDLWKEARCVVTMDGVHLKRELSWNTLVRGVLCRKKYPWMGDTCNGALWWGQVVREHSDSVTSVREHSDIGTLTEIPRVMGHFDVGPLTRTPGLGGTLLRVTPERRYLAAGLRDRH